MKDIYKTEEPFISELAGLRQRVAELEAIATEQKRLEEALKASQEVVRIMFESITDGISVIDLNGTITDANQRTSDHHNRLPRRR
jgi:PAS domain-containing protein